MSKSLFTLIELIAVIVTIAVLAAIIVPNVASVKTESVIVAVDSNLNHIQTSVDVYLLKNNKNTPSSEKPSLGKPQPIDFNRLYPTYLRTFPKLEGYKYWVDYKGKVWVSQADSPNNFRSSGDNIVWADMDGASSYNFYTEEGEATSKVSKEKISLLRNVKTNSIELPVQSNFYVSSIDENGFESAPVGIDYTGYQNQAPIAKITMTPNQAITTATSIQWSSSESIDPDGDRIIDVEWKGKQQVYGVAGTYTVELRVQDSNENWSKWTSHTFSIQKVNEKPVAVLEMSPSSNIETNTYINWSAASSIDADGDSIVNKEWRLDSRSVQSSEPNGVINVVGTHVMKLRVQDSNGLWSDWVEKTFTVSNPNRNPVANFYLSNPAINSVATSSTLSWVDASTDPDGDSIAAKEFKLNGMIVSSFPNKIATVGNHTIDLRVKDSKGAWSDWKTIIINVQHPVNYIVGGQDYLHKSDLRFSGWTSTHYNPLVSSSNSQVSVSSMTGTGDTIVVSANNGHIIRSTDRGDSWSYVGRPFAGSIRGMAINGSTIVGSAWFDKVIRSTDSGASWETLTLGASTSQTDIANNGNTFVITAGNQVYRSTDNGLNWSIIGIPNSLNGIGSHNSNFVVVGSVYNGNGDWHNEVHLSTDNGKTWTKKYSYNSTGTSDPLQLRDVAIYGNTIVAVGRDGKALVSNNLGGSWTRINLTSGNLSYGNDLGQVFYDEIENKFFVVGGHSIFTSAISGMSWSTVSSPDKFSVTNRMHILH